MAVLCFTTSRILAVFAIGSFAIISGPAQGDSAETLSYRGQLSWINVFEATKPDQTSLFNPGNSVLKLPSDSGISELRPDFKIVSNSAQIVVRPRVRYTFADMTIRDEHDEKTGTTKATLNEAFVQWTASNHLTFVYGRQNYQWGPTEVLSPSNRLFHDQVQQRDVLYETPGKDIARLNFSWRKSISAVLMVNYQQNKDEAPFTAGEIWQPTGVLKLEYNWNQGVDYFGVVGGAQANGHPWVGEYFNKAIRRIDGLSIFADVSQSHGNDAWYPTTKAVQSPANPVGPASQVIFVQSLMDSHKPLVLADVGLKFDFVNGVILRGEYVYNRAGYDQSQRKLALQAFLPNSPLQQPVFATNLQKVEASGLDLPGQRYAYASIHVPDFIKRDLNFDARSLYSTTDRTSYNYFSFDYRVGDSGTLTLAVIAGAGRLDGELRGQTAATEYVAYRHDW